MLVCFFNWSEYCLCKTNKKKLDPDTFNDIYVPDVEMKSRESFTEKSPTVV